jgi:hypothetical protein
LVDYNAAFVEFTTILLGVNNNFTLIKKHIKMKKVLLVLSVISIVVSSCKKDTTPAPVAPTVYAEENFLDGYLNKTGFEQKIIPFIGSAYYNLGFDFAPLVKGKITSLKVKLPAVIADLKIVIWDKATTTSIKTEIVNVAAVNTSFTIDIADIDLVKDKEYAISMSAISYYLNKRTNNSSATYPVIVDNIKILGHKESPSAATSIVTYPAIATNNQYAGNVSFNFQRTE